ncbi:hypothetical protein ACIREM_12810 [Streptomyces shenzhenensis]|uniref:hypothetical protein n=1 Tax=Streptomyces shenzhenensis TaxID=943815 RepID=UPI0037FDE7CC
MTAEHDPYDLPDGTDALLAAITGEAGPAEAAGTDPRAAAEHRSAQADVALLREQLRIIGDALAAPAPAARPAPRRAPKPARPRRRFLALAVGTLAVACVVTVLSGLAWLLAGPGPGLSAGADDSAAKAESRADHRSAYTACARLVVEGEVVGVETVAGTGSQRVTLRVTRYYRPERGEAEVTVVTDEAVAPRPRPGEHVLLAVPRGADSPDLWVTGEREIARQRSTVEREVAVSPASGCP